LKEQNLYRTLRRVESAQGPRIRMDGGEYLCLASNDYLGLASHPRLKEASRVAVERWGTGSGASRLLSGSSLLAEELEDALAAFLDCEAVLVFNSGYAANTGVISSLTQPGDLIFSDALNHASIIDGCRLSPADIVIYKHSDIDDLRYKLKVTHCKGSRWIVTDGVFSMDGDIAPLPEIASLAEEFGAHLYVDEAHATGILGPKGQGTTSHFGVEKDVTLRMGTLGKALGSFGAYVAGSQGVIEFLVNRARPLVYSTALPPAALAASREAVDLVQEEDGKQLRARLRSNVALLAEGLEGMGFRRGCDETPILPILLGTAREAMVVAGRLFAKGIYAPAIRPPTVPEGTSRIRLSIMATHTPDEMKSVLTSLGDALALETGRF
jgi:8-amino-7-oxononanoate synthase